MLFLNNFKRLPMFSMQRILLVFLFVILVAWTMLHGLGLEFGSSNYWHKHGIWFLIFMTMFPRVTLLLSSVASGGVFWWLGWFFAPRFLVALLATVSYWNANPLLVFFAWLVALGGEPTEKYYMTKNVRIYQS